MKQKNCFNDYFINVAGNWQSQIDNITSPINLLKIAYHSVSPRMETVPVTKGEIISILSSLKMKNSSGYEGISIKIKMCSPFISDPLSFICNMSIMSSAFPNRLKYAVVEPLYVQEG
jgi:hypothetical protein